MYVCATTPAACRLQEALKTVLTAADIYMAISPEDLIPHPATFYEAMANGCAVIATPFKAALAHMPSNAGRLLWDRAAHVVSRELLALVDAPELLDHMQQSAWNASRGLTWQHAGQAFLEIMLPLLA